jgi:hypothetical protein
MAGTVGEAARGAGGTGEVLENCRSDCWIELSWSCIAWNLCSLRNVSLSQKKSGCPYYSSLCDRAGPGVAGVLVVPPELHNIPRALQLEHGANLSHLI